MITEFLAFAEGPLLWVVFVFFGAGLLLRTVFFVLSIIRRRPSLNPHPAFNASPFLILRLLLPFHNAVLKKPFYSLLRYVFHICLFVVPIWYAGHVSLWEESRFEWYWTPLPDNWADTMTLMVLAICCYFLLRRIILGIIRKSASIGDYLFIILTALPFLTGYLYTHGNLDHIPFFLGDVLNGIPFYRFSDGEKLLDIFFFKFIDIKAALREPDDQSVSFKLL